ncbi:UPF0179 family protein [Methanoculleus sp. FWC-SCC1]|uniref:UPF0179 protein FGU65_09740 n=1 Tax=Methanoculleus frigidifontis TaxID=2584085 RepID=A0ABT8MB60_9EURY|nr:UPF0179 family protein [Methanoculleus sp. FWC-SCC1]MDN7025168.1 UPF0179 family protein [Methanoculleus sp. FWC-SCC1]
MILKKTKVTLIGSMLAKQDLEFIYEGFSEECEGCKMRKACHNLQQGKKYRIVEVRPGTKHDCPVHMDSVNAVEVVESPVVALISADMAIVNSKIQYEFSCTRTACRSYELCHPEGIIEEYF